MTARGQREGERECIGCMRATSRSSPSACHRGVLLLSEIGSEERDLEDARHALHLMVLPVDVSLKSPL